MKYLALACGAGLVVGGGAMSGCANAPNDAFQSSPCMKTGAALQIDTRICAGSSIVQGVDVSTYDSTVDWTQAASAGIQFAFARISDGTTHPDDQFAANWPGMRAAGVIRGAYQYFRASEDPTAQANLVMSSLQQAGGLQAGDLPVVMDIETADGQSAGTIQANMQTWLDAIQQQTGRMPIIYTSAGTFPVGGGFSTYPLWVANYGASCPSMPADWTVWVFWQYSSTGSVAGIGSGSVDQDEFNGTLSDLISFAGGSVGPGDSGGPPDSGPPDSAAPPDSGAQPDSGAVVDASAPPDSGAPSEAGAVVDSGSGGPADSGSPADAGHAMGEAGGPPPEGGTPVQPCGAP